MRNSLLAIISLLVSLPIFASQISITDGKVRKPIPGMANTVGYFKINNLSDSDITFISASSKVARAVEFHTHEMTDGVMKMKKLDQLMLKQGEQKVLQPGGLHLMFLGLTQRKFDNVTVTLQQKNGKQVQLELQAESIHSGHHHHH